MEKGGVRSWLLNTFAVNKLINESHKLKQRILFEKIPSGQRYLTPIIEAMRDEMTLEMTYQSFGRKEPTTFEIEPYCVKIFKQRWYVVARSKHYNAIRIYSLDRIHNLRITEKSFKLPKGFCPETFFDKTFGIIIVEKIEPCDVQLKVFGRQRQYLQTLPLHHSQKETEVADNYSVFSYFLSPTFDFKQELLSHGDSIEVISPDWFRKELKETVKNMSKHYNSK
jgi:predicted DNA-binding transcriptional regulator YafY